MQPDENTDARPPERPDPLAAKRTLAFIVAATAVVAAVLGGRAAYLSDNGGDTWQRAVRNEVKQAAGIVETLQFVYQNEAPTALALIEAEVRLEELTRGASQATGLARTVLKVEAQAQRDLIDALQGATELAGDDRYRLPDGGFDLTRRVVDERARFPELAAVDPDVDQRDGDLTTRQGIFQLAATVPVAFAFAFGALGQAFARVRKFFFFLAALLLVGAVAAGIVIELGGA